MKNWLLTVSVLIFVAGCASYKPPVSDDLKYDLSKPIDCSSAKDDIRVLEGEKSEVVKQVKAGVKMFVPVSAARSILHGDYRDQKQVATGEYGQAIDDKIKEIRNRCGDLANE